MKPRSTTKSRHPQTRMDSLIRAAWVIAGALVTVLLLGVGLTYVTASPAVCASCHAMAPKVEAWRTSPHTQVGCPSCHETPRPWYLFPQTLAIRSVMLTRDINAHLTSTTVQPASSNGTDTPVVADEICLQCHDLSRVVTMRAGTLIDHNEHAKRNKSCVSCHLYTAHPDPDAEKPLLLMAQCFNCHGRTSDSKAPGTCDVCHPKSFALKPQSHTPASGWLSAHGKEAIADRQSCVMCHEAIFCQDCHGLDMPHPATWVKGKDGHAAFAENDRTVCAQCHKQRPDLCSMCHHKDLGVTKRPWVEQHPEMVKQRTAEMCMGCHRPVYCSQCHTKVAITGTPL